MYQYQAAQQIFGDREAMWTKLYFLSSGVAAFADMFAITYSSKESRING